MEKYSLIINNHIGFPFAIARNDACNKCGKVSIICYFNYVNNFLTTQEAQTLVDALNKMEDISNGSA